VALSKAFCPGHSTATLPADTNWKNEKVRSNQKSKNPQQYRVASLSEQEDKQCPDTMGFLGIAPGFVSKNPVPETPTGHRLRAVTGVLGVLFQLPGNFLKLTIYTVRYQSGSAGKINFSDRKKIIKTPKTPFSVSNQGLCFLALITTNVLTLTSTAFNTALSGLMGTALDVRTVSIMIRHAPSQ
jgi:hypothetical protein